MSNHTRRIKRRAIPATLRTEVMQRDGGVCAYCGFPATEIDHLVPVAAGGKNDPDNLVASCVPCNRILNDKRFDRLEQRVDHVREKYGPGLAKRYKIATRKLSVCADCGDVYSPQQRGATVLLCKTCYAADEDGLNGWI